MAYTTIKKPSSYFNTKLYTGTESSNSITGVGFQPDMVWIKNRSTTHDHRLADAVRGVPNLLYPSTTDVAGNDGNAISSLDSDGFTVGSSTAVNGNGNNLVAWNWLGANGTASNTDGSISSTVSANTTSGFSIVSYTSTGSNATVGHGLGVAPSMMIFKRRSGDTENWVVYHKSLGATKNIKLNLTDAVSTSSTRFNDTEPTSSVFSLGTSGDTNGGTSPFIAYCFAEKQGFSKFGSYTGNGNADGTFIYTGFKPAFVLIKETNTAGTDWRMMDNKRSTFNLVDDRLFPNLNIAENTGDGYDFLSNGFKIRSSGGDFNGIGDSYIYMAFAEEPLVGDNPATAR